MKIFGVFLQVFCQVLNPRCEESDLYLNGSGVVLVDLELFDDLTLLLWVERHFTTPPFFSLRQPRTPQVGVEDDYTTKIYPGVRREVERATGLEPATPSLGSWCSTN